MLRFWRKIVKLHKISVLNPFFSRISTRSTSILLKVVFFTFWNFQYFPERKLSFMPPRFSFDLKVQRHITLNCKYPATNCFRQFHISSLKLQLHLLKLQTIFDYNVKYIFDIKYKYPDIGGFVFASSIFACQYCLTDFHSYLTDFHWYPTDFHSYPTDIHSYLTDFHSNSTDFHSEYDIPDRLSLWTDGFSLMPN